MTASRFNFRAYIKEYNMITYVEILHPEYIKDYDDRYYYLDEYECILMQSTGLTDKNGDEIYEGDIVAHIPSLSQVQCYIVENYYNLVFTKKNDKNFKIDLHYVVNNNLLEKMEVVGNIFENKDLLKN